MWTLTNSTIRQNQKVDNVLSKIEFSIRKRESIVYHSSFEVVAFSIFPFFDEYY